jgi:hypothetical protein
VANRSPVPLTALQVIALGQGLNFVPTPLLAPGRAASQLKQAFLRFARSTRLRAQFKDTERQPSLFHLPNPRFQPEPGPDNLEDYLESSGNSLFAKADHLLMQKQERPHRLQRPPLVY